MLLVMATLVCTYAEHALPPALVSPSWVLWSSLSCIKLHCMNVSCKILMLHSTHILARSFLWLA